MPKPKKIRLRLDSYNLALAERALINLALDTFDNLAEAAEALGITRQSLKRRILMFSLAWPRFSRRSS